MSLKKSVMAGAFIGAETRIAKQILNGGEKIKRTVVLNDGKETITYETQRNSVTGGAVLGALGGLCAEMAYKCLRERSSQQVLDGRSESAEDYFSRIRGEVYDRRGQNGR